MLITNITEFTSEQIDKLTRIYSGKVEVIEDLNDEHACDWDQVEILISYGHQVNKAFLDRCSNLKWIQAFQSGVERFPLEELRKRNIILTNMVGIHAIPMSEYTISMILFFARDFQKYLGNQRKHLWDREELVGEAHGKVAGILGAGRIGQEIARRLEFLGMKVYGMNTSGKLKPHFHKMYTPDKKLDLLQQCDFVILILPLTKQTENLIGEEELTIMKNDACLINIGRGPLINERAFIKAMKTNEIRGAALDVFHEEPLPEDSPLWDLENVLITPHVAAKTVKFLDRCIDKFRINADNYLTNMPLDNEIDLNRGY
ncbi:D-2-hydroxyacid dehydrogenase [Virgibacillus kimchii]